MSSLLALFHDPAFVGLAFTIFAFTLIIFFSLRHSIKRQKYLFGPAALAEANSAIKPGYNSDEALIGILDIGWMTPRLQILDMTGATVATVVYSSLSKRSYPVTIIINDKKFQVKPISWQWRHAEIGLFDNELLVCKRNAEGNFNPSNIFDIPGIGEIKIFRTAKDLFALSSPILYMEQEVGRIEAVSDTKILKGNNLLLLKKKLPLEIRAFILAFEGPR